ncbi:carbohydrate-binding protein CenC [Serratia rubidaea]|uniref:carbohydrate-binding protein CenC n=1 Tax=Serratia rubidaea TaxID=61652 RepID=UPI00242F5470|nr:carbohydrate-binding protein CenC [Serratia rubidaea]MCR1000880.1 carbohydrate-binding protein CenC [Serratia rubidaea]
MSGLMPAIAAAALLHTMPPQDCAPNLLHNPGFEQGLQGWRGAGAGPDSVAHGGAASLRYHNPDDARYRTFSQTIAAQPGQTIAFGAWLKGRGLQGPPQDRGASVYIQSFDAQGRFLEGRYPAGIVGDSDWRPISARYRVPQRAARVTLGLYLRRGTTGTAWFDDVYACALPPQATLYPANGRTLIETPQPQWVTVSSVLLDRQRKVIDQTKRRRYIADRQWLTYTPPPLPPGEYRLRQQVTEAATGRRRSSEIALDIGQPTPAVTIDGQGFTRRHGERLFPLGIYSTRDGDDDLARIAAAGFNSVLNYRYGLGKDADGFFRRSRRHGLQVIYAIKDLYAGSRFAPATRGSYAALAATQINRLKNQPNLLAWYINDELGLEFLPQIAARHQQVQRLDRHHPTFQVLNKTAALDDYYNSTDILATDPYPVGSEPHLRRTLHDTLQTVRAARGVKGAWMVIQIMDHAAYDSRRQARAPTEDEVRAQAWLALIGGARGLLFYSYNDLFYQQQRGRFERAAFAAQWRGIARVARQIRSFSPYLLTGDGVTLRLEGPAAARIFVRGDSALLLAANPEARTVTLSLTLPDGWHHQTERTLAMSLPPFGAIHLPLQR